MAKKRGSSARFAVLGLILAAIGCLATGTLGIVRGSMAMGLYTPAKSETITQGIAISVGILVLGLALYVVLNPAGARRFFTGRQARYGSNAALMTLAFIGILVVVNWLAFQNPKQFDLTEDKQHTLAPETIQALETLPEAVTAIGFYSTQYPRDTAETLFNDLKGEAKGKFDFRFVDPNADPVTAREFGITGDGKIVLMMGDARESVSCADENLVTQAMIRLISPQARVVYFLTGHGEPDLEASDTTSMLRAKQTLESKNYTVQPLNLGAENKIPGDAKTIVIAGATEPLLSKEVDLIREYLQQGGSLVLLSDPDLLARAAGSEDPLAAYLAAQWGMMLDNTIVMDEFGPDLLSPISASWSATSPITSYMTTYTIMPQSRSLTVAQQAPENVTLTPLLLSSEQSWAETDLEKLRSTKEVAPDPASDIMGPVALAASAENSVTRGRLVVFGSSTFARNAGFDAYANGDVFVSAVDWAAQETDLINITPKNPITRTFNPPGQLTFLLILFGSVILIPGLVVVAGVSSWLQRRRHG